MSAARVASAKLLSLLLSSWLVLRAVAADMSDTGLWHWGVQFSRLVHHNLLSDGSRKSMSVTLTAETPEEETWNASSMKLYAADLCGIRVIIPRFIRGATLYTPTDGFTFDPVGEIGRDNVLLLLDRFAHELCRGL
jgi:hypothetical protein